MLRYLFIYLYIYHLKNHLKMLVFVWLHTNILFVYFVTSCVGFSQVQSTVVSVVVKYSQQLCRL